MSACTLFLDLHVCDDYAGLCNSHLLLGEEILCEIKFPLAAGPVDVPCFSPDDEKVIYGSTERFFCVILPVYQPSYLVFAPSSLNNCATMTQWRPACGYIFHYLAIGNTMKLLTVFCACCFCQDIPYRDKNALYVNTEVSGSFRDSDVNLMTITSYTHRWMLTREMSSHTKAYANNHSKTEAACPWYIVLGHVIIHHLVYGLTNRHRALLRSNRDK